MKKSRSKKPLIAALIVLALIFALVTFMTAQRTYEKRIEKEQLTELDFYSMQQFSADNAKAVMNALKSGDAEKLKKLMPGAEGIDEVMAFADWSRADFGNAESMGAGSLSAAPDENGFMDISERFFVNVGDTKYVLFVETLTSRWGRQNEGVTAVGVTTYDHFDDIDYDWSGKPDDHSVLAGELWWDK
ncbi:MAG: hypothetical protein IJJ16_01825 [Mogibacterium sp.]|nr:hypothetical protein [Mogibacterium sp.]